MNNVFFISILFFNHLSSSEFSKKVFSLFTCQHRYFSYKPTFKNLEHIFGPKKILKCKFPTLHHDYMRQFENMGYYHLKNVVNLPNGVYFGKIQRKLPNGHKIHSLKSFFPKEWTQEKVKEKILEAYNNYKGEFIFEYGKAIITSETDDKIKMKIVINNKYEIITAYPILDIDED